MAAPRFQATTMKLPIDVKTKLRNVKTGLQEEGIYATHELIVSFLIRSIEGRRFRALRTSLRGIKPPLRGRHKKKKRSRRPRALLL